MKKILISTLIVLLLALTVFIMIKGVPIGQIEILGIKGIQQKNSELDEKIQEAGKLVERDYQQALADVKNNTKKLQEEKKNYQDMTDISEEGEIQAANQLEKYEIETLWVKLGNHATKYGANMQMDVTTASNSAKGVYNLKFTATGGYIQITDFISAIENDSTLGFKIEEFSMKPSNTAGVLQATFTCKDIAIKEISATTSTNNSRNTNNTTNSTNTTGGNNTNTNSTNNTNSTSNTTNTSGTNTTR